jgi:hypothetical protein
MQVSNLQWTTAKELSVNYFVVERSLDGQHFSPIANVASLHHSSNTSTDYETMDQSACSRT